MSARTLIAGAAAVAVVLGSPLIGELRSALLRAFPRYYVLIIASGVVLGGIAMLAVCLRVIHDHRPRRFGLLALAVALALTWFALLRSGNPNVDAVEAFHFVEYGALTLLFFPFGHDGGRWEPYVETALTGTAVAIADEWFQWFVPGRAGELHDVFVDLIAITCGLLLCLAVRRSPLVEAAAAGHGGSDPPRRTAWPTE